MIPTDDKFLTDFIIKNNFCLKIILVFFRILSSKLIDQ